MFSVDSCINNKRHHSSPGRALSARTASHAAAACRRAQTVTHNNLSAMQDGISRTINLTTLVLGNKHLTLEFLE